MKPLEKRSASRQRSKHELREVLISKVEGDEAASALLDASSSVEPEDSPLYKPEVTMPQAAFRPSRERAAAASTDSSHINTSQPGVQPSASSGTGLPPTLAANQPPRLSPAKQGILKKANPEPLTVELPESRSNSTSVHPIPSTSQPAGPSFTAAASREHSARLPSFSAAAAAKPPRQPQPSHSFSAAQQAQQDAALAALPPLPGERSSQARSMMPDQSASWTSKRQGFPAQVDGKAHALNGLQFVESPDSMPKESFRIPAAGTSGRQHPSAAGDLHTSDDGSQRSSRNANLDCFDEPTKKGLDDNNEDADPDDGAGSAGQPDADADDMVVEPKKKRAHWRRWKFWHRELPAAASVVIMGSAVSLYILQRNLVVAYFALWRWCLFFSCFAPVFLITHAIMHWLVSFMETHFLATRRLLYYIIGMRKGVERLLRAGFIIGVFAATFQDRARVRGVEHVYFTLLRLLCCIVLFASANVVKTLLAKLMSSHFYQETHFQKMQDALRKEFFLLSLSQPRHNMDEEQTGAAEKPHGMAGLRTKSFAAVTRLMTRRSLVVPPPSKPQADGVEASATGVQPSRATTIPVVKPSAKSVSALSPPRSPHHNHEQANNRGASFSHMRPHLAPGSNPINPSSPKGKRGPASFTIPARGPTSFIAPAKAAASFGVAQGKRPDSFTGAARSPSASMRSFKSDDRRSLQSLASMLTDKPPEAQARSRLRFVRAATAEKVGEQSPALVSLPSKPSQDHDFIAKLHMVEKHIRKNKLKLTFSDQLGRAQHTSDDITSTNEAKKLAFYIFWNVKAKHDRNYVIKEDFKPFLTGERIDEAFETLDIDKDGKISLADMRDAVLKVYLNRKHLALTLKDTKTVVGKLERIFGFIIHFVFIFFYLMIWGIDLSKVWFTTSSLLLSFVFVFGNSIRTVYESVVFLFVVHPFDVGDGVLIGQSQDYCVVEEIALLNTTLLRWDGSRILYPNAKLNSDQMINMTRSANRGEVWKVLVDVGTPKSVFDTIDASLKAFVKDHPDFNCASVNPGGPADPYKFTLSVYYEFTFNSSDRSRYFPALAAIKWAIIEALAKANLQYTLPNYRTAPSDMQQPPVQALAGAGATGLPALL